MSRVLVTGGAGFIGTNLINRLVKEGHDVVSIDDYSTGTTDNHNTHALYQHQNVQSLQYEYGMNFEKVYHLAALSRIQPSFNYPSLTFNSNVKGTEAVLEFARKSGAKVIYAGSSSKWHNPYQSPYAAYKYLGEEVCKMYKSTYGMDVEIARFYNVYGPKEIVDGDMAALIGIWRDQISKGKALTIVGDGEQLRDFTHVDDIVDGLYKIGFKTEVHEDAWELGTGVNYSVNEVYHMFKDRYKGITYTNLPDQPGNYRCTLRENNDAQERLGWKPKDRLEQYISTL